MTIIKDIQLYYPKDNEKNWKLFQETRCMTFLYSRLLPKLHTKDDRGVQIYCLDHLVEAEELDTLRHVILDYAPVYLETDIISLLNVESDLEKKKKALVLIHEGMKRAASMLGWDVASVDQIYTTIEKSGYQNQYPLIKKMSPNKKYVCTVWCHHEVHTIDLYLELKKRNGEVIKKELLFSTEDRDEQNLFNKYGTLKWNLNHKVEFADHDYKNIYRLTFLEKETQEDLYWKLKRIM